MKAENYTNENCTNENHRDAINRVCTPQKSGYSNEKLQIEYGNGTPKITKTRLIASVPTEKWI